MKYFEKEVYLNKKMKEIFEGKVAMGDRARSSWNNERYKLMGWANNSRNSKNNSNTNSKNNTNNNIYSFLHSSSTTLQTNPIPQTPLNHNHANHFE